MSGKGDRVIEQMREDYRKTERVVSAVSDYWIFVDNQIVQLIEQIASVYDPNDLESYKDVEKDIIELARLYELRDKLQRTEDHLSKRSSDRAVVIQDMEDYEKEYRLLRDEQGKRD